MSVEQQKENQEELFAEEFVLVDKSSDKTDSESNSHNSVRSMDDFSTGSFVQNTVELNVVQNIKKLADDNEALKKSLVRHNRMIEVGLYSIPVRKNMEKKPFLGGCPGMAGGAGRGYWPGHFQNFSIYFANPGHLQVYL